MRTSLASLAAMAFLLGLIVVANVSGEDDPAAPLADGTVSDVAEMPIDFTRDIRPILSDRCFACHGPEEASREGELRFDVKESAFGEAESGEIAIVPGDVDASEMIWRILSEDEDEHMPPPDQDKQLTDEEISLLRRWVEQGAPWEEHWAFIAPTRPELPELGNADWCNNPIDHYILDRLLREGLTPSPEANKETLIRRVTFDLTGLPPTLEEVDTFLADESPEAYERVVNRLLASPGYGEHMARFWLDAARYGDTHGLHLDNYREMWPYRDWVVNAYNNNMPFDQFTIEQLAGDMLENATQSQRIASGFNRCNVTTGEGGSITEEVYVRNVVDRVVTTGTVFMGMTFECTRCHDHKFDPYTMVDFYSMFAFFNNIDMNPMDGNKKNHAPSMQVASADQLAAVEALTQKNTETAAAIASVLADVQYTDPVAVGQVRPLELRDVVWFDEEPPADAKPNGWNPTAAPNPVLSGEKSFTLTATGLEQQYFSEASATLTMAEDDVLFAYVYIDAENPPKEIMLQWNDGSWEHRAYWGENVINWGQDATVSRTRMGDLPAKGEWVRLEVPAATVGLAPGAILNGWAFTQHDGTVYWDKAGVATLASKDEYESFTEWESHQKTRPHPTTPNDIAAIVALEVEQRTEPQKQKLRDYFFTSIYPATRDQITLLNEQIAASTAQINELKKAWPTTLISRERANPKPSYLLIRGAYENRGEEVPRATPAALPPLPEGAPVNRLGFAQWLVDPSHPLTARVQVNRYWQQLLGTGIVKTSEDFGSQGEPPSHLELLNWLSVEFRDGGWDVKGMMKTIVMSSTYRQSSRMTPDMLERDPENRLLARGSRFRLDAEMIRDQALATSGLLVNLMGGPSVKPPQPAGLWFDVGYSGSNTVRFTGDTGPERVHRRTLYTFIKRTAPPPQMSILDGPSRETCSVRRERTNTPLGALMLMNDPQFVEAARALAQRAIREGGDSPEQKADFMYRLCTSRHANETRIAEQVSFYRDMLAAFQEDSEAATQLIGVGPTEPDADVVPAELAAWTMVANIVLNLDEVLNKN